MSTCFVEGRQILETVMASNEVVDDLFANKRDRLICKLDMEKAYDHVSWNFIDYMLGRMGVRLQMERLDENLHFYYFLCCDCEWGAI